MKIMLGYFLESKMTSKTDLRVSIIGFHLGGSGFSWLLLGVVGSSKHAHSLGFSFSFGSGYVYRGF